MHFGVQQNPWLVQTRLDLKCLDLQRICTQLRIQAKETLTSEMACSSRPKGYGWFG